VEKKLVPANRSRIWFSNAIVTNVCTCVNIKCVNTMCVCVCVCVCVWKFARCAVGLTVSFLAHLKGQFLALAWVWCITFCSITWLWPIYLAPKWPADENWVFFALSCQFVRYLWKRFVRDIWMTPMNSY